MNYKFINTIMFAAGAVSGSAVTWFVLKSKYEQRIQEEIETVKEAFIGMNSAQRQTDEETEDEEEEASEGYHQVNWDELEDLDEDELEEYADLTNMYSNEKGRAEKVEVQNPYVIEPMEFGEADGYKTVSLTYYADGILEDDKHKIVTDIEELIGKGSLDTFGDYEDDSVFVRNPRLRTDFEILKDYNTYEEATGKSPQSGT